MRGKEVWRSRKGTVLRTLKLPALFLRLHMKLKPVTCSESFAETAVIGCIRVVSKRSGRLRWLRKHGRTVRMAEGWLWVIVPLAGLHHILPGGCNVWDPATSHPFLGPLCPQVLCSASRNWHKFSHHCSSLFWGFCLCYSLLRKFLSKSSLLHSLSRIYNL